MKYYSVRQQQAGPHSAVVAVRILKHPARKPSFAARVETLMEPSAALLTEPQRVGN